MLLSPQWQTVPRIPAYQSGCEQDVGRNTTSVMDRFAVGSVWTSLSRKSSWGTQS